MKKIISGIMLVALICVAAGSANSADFKTYSIINKTGSMVTSVSISPAGANKWGDILNDTEKLKNNSGIQFQQDADNGVCAYDVKYISADGKEHIIANIDLCKSSSILLNNTSGNQSGK